MGFGKGTTKVLYHNIFVASRDSLKTKEDTILGQNMYSVHRRCLGYWHGPKGQPTQREWRRADVSIPVTEERSASLNQRNVPSPNLLILVPIHHLLYEINI
ncbi:hypothetical protein EGR_05748 [Echinococcus granulosus]|uniref:Uncharacterized protein n=1 Tax=Echinococcus granulosus TaxID=6210 RepID=W6V097_ECHGR|nr:hypothetical protein EGR_05748 [Echinococcus granulosus]EUB59394.1 hypothetical protein EGR_05748 [Echinococcus granulosus]